MATHIASVPTRSQVLRYLFDLTTTVHWNGAAVGIVRVEQELARRARRHLGNELAFSVYDPCRSAMRIIDDTVVDDLINGRIRVCSEYSVADIFQNPLRRQIRNALLKNTALYYLYQRCRGRTLTHAQILQIQAAELARTKPVPKKEIAGIRTQYIRLSELPCEPARLDAETMLISGGLDWQYKDLRTLWVLKQRYGFSYCAIIYDLIGVYFPHFVVPGYVEQVTDYFGELLWLADHTVCISQTTRRDWWNHASLVGAQPVPSSVFSLGCDLPSWKDESAELPSALHGKNFAIYVSTIEPRKNHRMLYDAWDECIRTKQLDPRQHRLVFVGRRGWATGDLLREIETNPLTRETIVLLHEVSDAQLARLYRNCSFVLFPSLYEGFGLPLAEALGYGKLCVSSNAAALSEIGGDLVLRLDPKDTLLWSNTIARLMSSSAEVREWERSIQRKYRPISWDEAAENFYGIISTLRLGRRSGTSAHLSRLQPTQGYVKSTLPCGASLSSDDAREFQ